MHLGRNVVGLEFEIELYGCGDVGRVVVGADEEGLRSVFGYREQGVGFNRDGVEGRALRRPRGAGAAGGLDEDVEVGAGAYALDGIGGVGFAGVEAGFYHSGDFAAC